MYYTSSSGVRFHNPQEQAAQQWVPTSVVSKEQAAEKRQQYQQNKTMFPNVSMHRKSRAHPQLQQSLSAEGYLEPTISGVGGPSDNHATIHRPSRSLSPDPRSPYSAPQKGFFHHSPFLGVRSISVTEPDDDDGHSQYSTHSSITDRHSYHGSSRAIAVKPPEVFPESHSYHGNSSSRSGSISKPSSETLTESHSYHGNSRSNNTKHRDSIPESHSYHGNTREMNHEPYSYDTAPRMSSSRKSPEFFNTDDFFSTQQRVTTRPPIAPKPSEVTPDPPRRSSASFYYPPPPPPIRTPPIVQVEGDRNGDIKDEEKTVEQNGAELENELSTDTHRETSKEPVKLTISTYKLQKEPSRDEVNSTVDAEVNMAIPTRIVLLACGSFNPITNMHLRLFELARDVLHRSGRYKVVGGIISPVSDKYIKKDLESAKHRIAMLKLALKSSDWIKLDTWESEQSTWSPTVKVLRHHREKLESTYNANIDGPSKKRKLESIVSEESSDFSCASFNNVNESAVQVKLLCGADLLESFDTPNLWLPEDMEEIVAKFGIVVINRAGSNAEQFVYNSDMLTKNQNNIIIATEWIQNEISATKIRRALRRGESVKYLMQDSVIDYIYQHRLYGAGDKCLLAKTEKNNKTTNNHSKEPAEKTKTEKKSLKHKN